MDQFTITTNDQRCNRPKGLEELANELEAIRRTHPNQREWPFVKLAERIRSGEFHTRELAQAEEIERLKEWKESACKVLGILNPNSPPEKYKRYCYLGESLMDGYKRVVDLLESAERERDDWKKAYGTRCDLEQLATAERNQAVIAQKQAERERDELKKQLTEYAIAYWVRRSYDPASDPQIGDQRIVTRLQNAHRALLILAQKKANLEDAEKQLAEATTKEEWRYYEDKDIIRVRRYLCDR